MRLRIRRKSLRQTAQDDDFWRMRAFVKHPNPKDTFELRPILWSSSAKEGPGAVKISL
jgi:hypothetical protein